MDQYSVRPDFSQKYAIAKYGEVGRRTNRGGFRFRPRRDIDAMVPTGQDISLRKPGVGTADPGLTQHASSSLTSRSAWPNDSGLNER